MLRLSCGRWKICSCRKENTLIPKFILYLVGSEVVAYGALNEEGFLKDGGDVTVTMVRAFGTEAVANELLKGAEDFILSTAEDSIATIEWE